MAVEYEWKKVMPFNMHDRQMYYFVPKDTNEKSLYNNVDAERPNYQFPYIRIVGKGEMSRDMYISTGLNHEIPVTTYMFKDREDVVYTVEEAKKQCERIFCSILCGYYDAHIERASALKKYVNLDKEG